MYDGPASTDVSVAQPLLSLRARFPVASFAQLIAQEIRDLFPGRVERLILFGSRARGDARENGTHDDSDWDVAVFLTGPAQPCDRRRLLRWSWDLIGRTGRVVSPRLFAEGAYADRTIFMHNLRLDAVDL